LTAKTCGYSDVPVDGTRGLFSGRVQDFSAAKKCDAEGHNDQQNKCGDRDATADHHP
jgi:hypothetical protein